MKRRSIVLVCWVAIMAPLGSNQSAFGVGSRRTSETRGQELFKRAMARLVSQPRFALRQHIATDPYDETTIRWLAPDRLSVQTEAGTALHVGDVGCINGRIWVCAHSDNLPFRRDALTSVSSALLDPQWLSRLQYKFARDRRRIAIRAEGDPWFYPPGCLGCGGPGIFHPKLRDLHYYAVLALDRHGRPRSLASWVTITSGPESKRLYPHKHERLHEQEDRFSYSGRWNIAIPHYRHVPCPSWDKTPHGWCMKPPKPPGL